MKTKHSYSLFFLLAAMLAAACAAALCLGPDGFGLPSACGQPGTDAGIVHTVLFEIRLPRVIMSAVAGAVLALCGLVMQTLFRNPLAEPYLLGVSGGASAGYTAALLCGLSAAAEGAAAFAGGMASLAAVLACGSGKGRYGILLSGVMANAFFGAVMLLLVSCLDPARLVSVVFWSMGSLGGCGLAASMGWAACMLVPAAGLCFFPGVLDMMLLGDEAADSMGIRAARVRAVMLAAVTFMVSASVAAAGPIGFVGLVVPQCMRLAIGGAHRRLMPASMLAGAFFLTACDTAARVLGGSGELAVGVVTAAAGAPAFIMLLRKR